MTASRQLWWRIVPAFAAGYFLSYALRTVNAVIAPELTRELAIGSAELGLLTSAYFLAFGLVQLPLGLLLDRFGPRRVEAALLLVAAAGAVTFGLGSSLTTLAGGRALIGLGVSACLMASLKAFSLWFPISRLPALTGAIMVAGGLGALSAATPVAAALPLVGWRGVFFLFAGACVLVAAALMTVPEKPAGAHNEDFRRQLKALLAVLRHRDYWQFAPQACFLAGGFMAIQSLWAVPWLMTINHASRSAAAEVLSLMALAMLGGFLFLATCSSPLAQRGITPMRLLSGGMALAVASGAAILGDLGAPTLLWAVLGVAFSLGNISYSQLTARFPVSLAGRVNTALNLAAFVGAFSLQWAFGLFVDLLAASGRTPEQSFRTAFATLLALQALSFAWFVYGERRRRRMIIA
jgi:MFS family permease